MCKFLPNHIYALARMYTVSRLGRLGLGQTEFSGGRKVAFMQQFIQ